MFITKCRWNHDGSVLALIGSTVLVGESSSTNVIQFFSPFGEVRINLVHSLVINFNQIEIFADFLVESFHNIFEATA